MRLGLASVLRESAGLRVGVLPLFQRAHPALGTETFSALGRSALETGDEGIRLGLWPSQIPTFQTTRRR